MSLWTDITQAISDLSELHDTFTEIDIVNLASSESWGETEFKRGMKLANQIASDRYRKGELVRYGPVQYGETKDYARKAGMIVYGGADQGPEAWDTPNGPMPRLPRHKDEIKISGRRKGTARRDEQPWEGQEGIPQDIRITVSPNPRRSRPGAGEVQRLRAELQAAEERAAQAEARVHELEASLEEAQYEAEEQRLAASRALAQSPAKMTRGEVESLVLELISPLESRLVAVERSVPHEAAA